MVVRLFPPQLGVVIDLKEKVARSSLASPSAVGCELGSFGTMAHIISLFEYVSSVACCVLHMYSSTALLMCI